MEVLFEFRRDNGEYLNSFNTEMEASELIDSIKKFTLRTNPKDGNVRETPVKLVNTSTGKEHLFNILVRE